jgi:hypothetical protein
VEGPKQKQAWASEIGRLHSANLTQPTGCHPVVRNRCKDSNQRCKRTVESLVLASFSKHTIHYATHPMHWQVQGGKQTCNMHTW